MQREDKKVPATSGRLREIMSVLMRSKINEGLTPLKLRQILEELGPTYIKLGQIMSLHSDILPKQYCDELMKLNSDVTPMPFETVEEVINRSYRCRWQDVFASIEKEPLGSASIAQVHKAKLLSGEDVIVKVQRKGIYDIMARDIGLMKRAVKLIPPIGEIRNLVDLNMVLDELWSVAQEEMDFLKEASNMEEFSRNNKDIVYVTCPKLYHEYTTSRVLVMEYVGGCPINDKEALKAAGYDLDEIGSKYVNNFIKQVMDDGFFHADPHPGNVKICDGKIVWIDMGMMGRLTERDRRIMVRGVQGIGMHDLQTVESAVLDLCDFRGKPDHKQLYKDLREFIETYGSNGMGSIDVAETMAALMEIMKKNKMSMPHGMTMLARGLAHVEGVLADISPDINMVQIAQARVTDDYLQKIDWKRELSHDGREIYRAVKKGIEIPSLTADALKQFLGGRSEVNLNLETADHTEQVIFQAVRNLVIGVCVAALLMSSSLIATTDMEPKILGIPALGMLGYIGALLIALFFSLRHWYRKRKKK